MAVKTVKTKMKIKKGDTVLVIAGKDKGAKGKVIHAYPERNRVLVEGVNRIKKHTRVSQNQRGAQSGGIVTQEAAIHVSNVMLVDSDGKPTRVGKKVGEDGKRVRVSRRSGKEI
jgi:large subunit ribosomal protein L24